MATWRPSRRATRRDKNTLPISLSSWRGYRTRRRAWCSTARRRSPWARWREGAASQRATPHGDGDGYGMGLGHMLHAIRRNIGIVDVVQNNRVYGLTKGQYSPTSDPGMRTPTSPEGAIDRPVPPLALAITMGATFVARGFPGELRHLVWLIGEALQHPGYALVDVLQPCVTFNRPSSYDFYNPRVYKLEDTDHDVTNKTAAWELAYEWGERIPIGIFYRVEGVPTYEEQVPALKAGPLVRQPLEKLRPEQIEALRAELI